MINVLFKNKLFISQTRLFLYSLVGTYKNYQSRYRRAGLYLLHIIEEKIDVQKVFN